MISNNSAIVTKITGVRNHINADRLNVGYVSGNIPVIIGKEIEEGALGLYFPEGTQLSLEFATANDLIRRKDAEGNLKGGMFEENRRVKALKLRGEYSEGFWIPLSSLWYSGYDVSTLKEGDSFQKLDHYELCSKYETPATKRQREHNLNKKSKVRKENFMMPKHDNTNQLVHNIHNIRTDNVVYITLKTHGTSQRAGHVLIQRPLKWWEKTLMKIGVKIETTEWVYQHGTRNCILDFSSSKEDFHGMSFRQRVAQTFHGKLHPGESVYFEVLGYQDENTPIMQSRSNEGMGKEFIKQYGNQTVFSYGNKSGEFSVQVYSIKQTQVDGSVITLTYNQMVVRCKELGVEPVMLLAGPLVFGKCNISYTTGLDYEDIFDEAMLLDYCATMSEGPDPIDPSHVREGVVVRVESSDGNVYFLKYKGIAFKLLEGIMKSHPDYVDEEEIS